MPKPKTVERPRLKEATATVHKGAFEKRWTAIKVADGENTAEAASLMHPSEDQLAKVNQFTRSPKSAEDVVVFPTLACNDIIDRDLDRFTTETIHGFNELEAPLGPVGKSYLVGHDHRSLGVGRIFDKSVEKVDKANHLKLWAYIPNTETNKSFIENLDFGVYWAVSVGVVIGGGECGLPWCKEPMYRSFFGDFCKGGHDKGLWYTEDAERDEWGYAESSEPDTKGAVLCHCDLKGAKDFYELSQVFLGAQYYAELSDKMPAIQKAASALKLPTVSLTRKEMSALFVEDFEKLQQAVRQPEMEVLDDGRMKWKDESGAVWVFSEGETTLLGKEERNAEGSGVRQEQQDDIGSQKAGSSSNASDSEVEPSGTGSETEGTQQPNAPDGGSEVGEEGNEVNGAKEVGDEEMTPDKLVAVARAAGVSTALLEKFAGLEPTTENLIKLLVEANAESEKSLGDIEVLKNKAAVGEQYVEDLKKEAIRWYVLSRQDVSGGDGAKGVDTAGFKKLLELCGDNIGVIKELVEQNKEIAQARFPEQVRRSTFESDHNETEKVDTQPKVDTKVARSIHG